MKITDKQIFDWCSEVLELEAQALSASSKKLSDNMAQIVRKILQLDGKVVTTGIGKSGIIARKCASTLSSTGTPSTFLHATEALHGDLGLISENDVLVAFSYGGENQETIDVAKFCRRADIPVVVISGKKSSTLASLADFFVDGAVEREADRLNLAPTCSSTVSLGIGRRAGCCLDAMS